MIAILIRSEDTLFSTARYETWYLQVKQVYFSQQMALGRRGAGCPALSHLLEFFSCIVVVKFFNAPLSI